MDRMEQPPFAGYLDFNFFASNKKIGVVFIVLDTELLGIGDCSGNAF